MIRRSGSLAGRRILVVDDEPSIRHVLVRFLFRSGAVALTADNATDALVILERESVDLVLTDVEMPGRSGLWLAEVIQDRWPGLPVLVMTGSDARIWERSRTIRSIVAVLPKPFDLGDLAQQLNDRMYGG